MSIEELTALVKPPERPVETGNIREWESFQKRMGMDFPRDLFEFLAYYGTGQFAGSDLEVLNPFSVAYPEILRVQIEMFRKTKEFDVVPCSPAGDPYDFYPNRPGLFPWGRDAHGYGLYWLSDGPPEEWPIVLVPPRELQAEEYHMPMTTFLAKAFRGEIQEPLRYEPISEETRFFIPAKL